MPTKTEEYLRVLAEGGEAPTGCCKTNTQGLIAEAAERVNELEEELEKLKPLSGSVSLNLANVTQQELRDYSTPFDGFNSFVGAKIREAKFVADSGDAASFVDANGDETSWADVLNAAQDGKNIEISSIDNLGFEASESGGVITFEPTACIFNTTIGPSVAFSHTEGDGVATISGFGFIGSDEGMTNYGGYFYPYCIDITFTRDESGKIDTASANAIYFATISYEE